MDDDALEKKNSESEKKPANNDIPLWLQGIEDIEGIEDTNPIDLSASAKDSWVKELSEEFPESDEIISGEEAEQIQSSPLPEWLQEASDEEPMPLSQDDIAEDVEDKTSIHVDENIQDSEFKEVEQDFIEVESRPLPVEQDINEETSVEALPEEEFIEISSMDIDQSQEEAHHIINKDDEIEELPEWLQEMISEPMQIEEEAIEDASTESEIKESESSSIKADYEELKNEVEESEEPSETLIEITEISTNETESEEIAEIIPEEETKPIEILPGDEETIEGQSEDAVPEVVEPIKQSHPLEFAKFQLDQGNIDQALEIFVSLKDRPDYQQYLSDIKDSLQDAISGKAKDHSAAWELVGDIAVLENNLDEAYDAYLQSIQLLLTSQKDKNETD